MAHIQDTINGLDTLLAPYGVTITETTNSSSANLVLDTGMTSACGGVADGVLGCFNGPAGEITMLQAWNWYAGADPTLIGASPYDFQSTVTHEFGHALGLGGATDPNSPKYETLAMGQVHRIMTVADLNLLEPPQGPDPEQAASPSWAGMYFFGNPATGEQSATILSEPEGNSLATLSAERPDVRSHAERGNEGETGWSATDFANAAVQLLEKGPSESLLSHSRLTNAQDLDDFWPSFAATKLLANTL